MNSIYRRTTLSVLSDMYANFNNLGTTRRGTNEVFIAYEARFVAFASKLDSRGLIPNIPEPIIVFVFISSAVIDDNQCVFILASTGNTFYDNRCRTKSTTSSAEIVEKVSFEKVAFTIQQCERQNILQQNTLHTYQSKLSGGGKSGGGDNELLKHMMNKYPYHLCQINEH